MSANPDFRVLYAAAKTWAVVGYSNKPERAGHFVAQYLKQQGYIVLAINPQFSGEVDGLPAYASLADIPAEIQVDVVDVFRAPEFVPAVLEAAAARTPRPRYFWMQPGAENAEAAQQALALGITPVQHACALAEHRRLFG